MSDYDKLINASDLIEWIMETYPDWCVGAVRSIVDHIAELPSAQPEVIRCKDCKWWDKYSEKHGYCMAAKHGFMSSHWEIGIYRRYDEDFFCADAEPKAKKGGIDEQND